MVNSASATNGAWSVDLCGGSPDGSLVVSIEGPQLYLYFTSDSLDVLQPVPAYLGTPSIASNLRIGTFCTSLFVELDGFEKEPEVVYLSVTRPDDQAMAYALRRKDCAELADALRVAIEKLAKQLMDCK